MPVVLQPNESYVIRENRFRAVLIVKCEEDFEFDSFPMPGNTTIMLNQSIGEPASNEHWIKNLSSVENVCYIQEYFYKE